MTKFSLSGLVDRAVAQIKPPRKRIDECKKLVRSAIAESSESSNTIATARWVSPSQDKRDAAERLHVALSRLQSALKDPDLDRDLRLLSPDQLDDWLKQTIAAGAEKTGKTIQLKALRKMIAAEQAIDLLVHFNKDKEISAKDKRGPLCRLAAILYGDPEANLQYSCRVVLRKIQSEPMWLTKSLPRLKFQIQLK